MNIKDVLGKPDGPNTELPFTFLCSCELNVAHCELKIGQVVMCPRCQQRWEFIKRGVLQRAKP